MNAVVSAHKTMQTQITGSEQALWLLRYKLNLCNKEKKKNLQKKCNKVFYVFSNQASSRSVCIVLICLLSCNCFKKKKMWTDYRLGSRKSPELLYALNISFMLFLLAEFSCSPTVCYFIDTQSSRGYDKICWWAGVVYEWLQDAGLPFYQLSELRKMTLDSWQKICISH